MSLTPRLDRIDSNLIINGGLHFWQRGTTATVARTGSDGTTNAYLADRFKATVVRNGSDVSIDLSRQTSVPTGTLFPFSIRATRNTFTSLGSTGAVAPIYQLIEGNMIADLSASSDIYVSFWVLANWTGNLAVAVELINGSSYSTFTWLESVTSGVWKKVTRKLTLPGFNFARDASAGMSLVVGGLTGTTHSGAVTLNQWNPNSGFYYSHSSATNWMATAGNYVQVTGVKISRNDFSEWSFAGRNYTEELQLCQRYYEKSNDLESAPGSNISGTGQDVRHDIGFVSGGGMSIFQSMKVNKRVTPNATVWSDTGVINSVRGHASGIIPASISASSTSKIVVSWSIPTGNLYFFQWTADAEL